MQAGPCLGIEKTATLLERAYRLALVMQGRACPADLGACDVSARVFENLAVAHELVAVLDEARTSLLTQVGATTDSQV